MDVQRQRDYVVNWRFISLAVLNEDRVADWYTPDYRAGHVAGLHQLRVAAAVADEATGVQGDPGAVGRLYTELGTMIHLERRRDDGVADPVAFAAEALRRAGLPESYAEHALDESWDRLLRDETALALERTGKDVGTPILTFHPGAENEASFFGPVIAKAPKGEDAVKLWDAIELIATSSGMAELKRSNRAKLDFT